MSRLATQHATLAGRMRAAGATPAIRFANDAASLYRGYVHQRETNSRLWHDNRALRAALHRAIDAMSRPPENAITDPEWDQIIAEGRNVLGDGNG